MRCKAFFLLLLPFLFVNVNAQNIDLRLLNYINRPANSADGTWRFASNSLIYVGAGTPISMLTAGLATHNHELTTKGIETGVAFVTAGLASVIIKDITHRDRPYIAHPDIIFDKIDESGYSFPSGHASVAFATATSLSLSFPKWYVIAPAYTYATLVGYSRLYLGVHYPSDVLGGAVVGAGSALLSWKLQQMLQIGSRHPKRSHN